MSARPLRTAISTLLAFQFGCAAAGPPVATVAPSTGNISEAEIQQELRTVRRAPVYGILLALAGGVVGTFAGGKIGYEIDYPHDLREGCEDCGLDGMLWGAGIGATTGLVGGALLGSKLDRDKRRAEAIRRIRVRRAAAEQGRDSASPGLVDTPMDAGAMREHCGSPIRPARHEPSLRLPAGPTCQQPNPCTDCGAIPCRTAAHCSTSALAIVPHLTLTPRATKQSRPAEWPTPFITRNTPPPTPPPIALL